MNTATLRFASRTSCASRRPHLRAEVRWLGLHPFPSPAGRRGAAWARSRCSLGRRRGHHSLSPPLMRPTEGTRPGRAGQLRPHAGAGPGVAPRSLQPATARPERPSAPRSLRARALCCRLGAWRARPRGARVALAFREPTRRHVAVRKRRDTGTRRSAREAVSPATRRQQVSGLWLGKGPPLGSCSYGL